MQHGNVTSDALFNLLTTLLQCFDTVGWVTRPVKTVGCITYTVLVQTLNHAQSINALEIRVLVLDSCGLDFISSDMVVPGDPE